MFSSLLVIAQGGGGADVNVDVGTDGGGSGFFSSPVAWIIGAAVFILLLVALTRGRSRD